MAKNYLLNFTNGNPTLSAGLAPTMIVFKTMDGTSVTAPGITAIPTNSGLYYFTYGPTNTISFVVDGFTSGLGTNRYIVGAVDPIDAVDEQLTGVGNSMLAQGVSILAQGVSILAASGGNSSILASIGSTASTFGDTSTMPGTLYGYLKRLLEFNEGDSIFTKSTGLWDIYSRGASTLLAQKGIVDDTSTVTKS